MEYFEKPELTNDNHEHLIKITCETKIK